MRRRAALVILAALAAAPAKAQARTSSAAALTEAVCTSPELAATVPADRIGEPVSEQLDCYESMLEAMGRRAVDSFARLYVLPQTGRGLTGSEWVENGTAPGKSVVVTSAARSLPMCSYPTYPRYEGGPAEAAESYVCAAPTTRR